MRRLLEEIIKEWWSWSLPAITKRQADISGLYDEKLKKIITVTGFRRVGKTYLLFDFARRTDQKNCIYVNFEDERIPQETRVLTELISVIRELGGDKKFTLLLDEIQVIPDWSRWARRINDTHQHDLIITGSSSRLSSSELPTELRGRALTLEVAPLSFKEYLDFSGKDFKALPRDARLNLLRDYLEYGGFPEIVLAEQGKKRLILDDYYKTFLLRDIFERYRPRHKTAFRDLVRILLNSTMISIGKLTNTLKSLNHRIGKSTVSNYLNWLKESYFLHPLQIHSPRVKDRIQYPRKIYFIDNFFISRYSTSFSRNIGRLMENLVARHLMAHSRQHPELDVFYFRDAKQREADFVLTDNVTTRQIFQVTYASDISEIADRETAALIKAGRDLKCSKLTVITWDLEEKKKIEGKKVSFIPLYKFLMSPSLFAAPP